MARKHGDSWYVAGLNGTDKELTLNIELQMFAGNTVQYYTDNKKKGNEIPASILKTLKVGKDGTAKITMQPMGGAILRLQK